ncbi:GNAT family N-acetyltransferase [Erythrobacter crassostreae]|uniref:N-acetyltransferase n=1 Tax=Erythrobacter crassostreae TaxID=2828328 RepID=A0A9X1JJZ4_9SPHN|nr:GNAT family N-acetyltransferase [Erythrobacter crassostrea]MBV7258460.1 N-acetyltransferase [Erythrobacter crassostrea]
MSGSNETTITHHPRGEGGRYVAEIAGEERTGHLDWEPAAGGIRIATHTIVPPEIGGRGIAAQLVDRLTSDAREQSFKIIPQCWYVAKKFDQNPEWADLRA